MRIYTCSTAVVYWYSLPNHWVQLVSDNSIFFKIVNISCKFVYLRSSYFSIIINDHLKFKKNKKKPQHFPTFITSARQNLSCVDRELWRALATARALLNSLPVMRVWINLTKSYQSLTPWCWQDGDWIEAEHN